MKLLKHEVIFGTTQFTRSGKLCHHLVLFGTSDKCGTKMRVLIMCGTEAKSDSARVGTPQTGAGKGAGGIY